MTEQREASMGEVIQAAQRFAQRAGRPVVDGALAPATSAPAPTSTNPTVAAPATPATPAVPAAAVTSPPAVPGRVAPRPARPLTPAEAGGRLRYVGSVAAAGARRAPVVVWDALWDRAKIAVYREGQTHRGPVDDRHRQAYMDAVARRKQAVGRVVRGVLAPWTAWKARVGRVPVPAVTWGVTAGCAAAARWPEAPLLRAFAQLNGVLAEAATTAGAVLGTAALYGGGAVLLAGLAYGAGKAMRAEHAERQALARQRGPVAAEQAPDEVTGELLTTAFRDAGVIAKDQVLRYLVPPTQLVGPVPGWSTVVALPPGLAAKRAVDRRVNLASALGVEAQQLIVEPAPGSAGNVGVWVFTEDPWGGGGERSPLLDAAAASVFDRNRIGVDARGRDVTTHLIATSLLVVAPPGTGKSVTARVLAAPAILDAHTRVLVCDGKGSNGLLPLRDLAEVYLRGATVEQGWMLLDLIKRLREEGDRRFDLFATELRDRIPDDHITRDVHSDHQVDVQVIYLIIDEVQEYFALDEPTEERDADGKKLNLGQAIAFQLMLLCKKQARAGGIIPILLTQGTREDEFPTVLRGAIQSRMALRVDDTTTSNTVLGAGVAGQGWDASRIEHKGVAILKRGNPDAGTKFEQVKVDFIRGGEFAALCRRGAALRQAAGTLRGHAAGQESPLLPGVHPAQAARLVGAAGAAATAAPVVPITPARPARVMPACVAALAQVLEDHETGVDGMVATAELADRIGYAGEDAAARLGSELRRAFSEADLAHLIVERKKRMPGYPNPVSVQSLTSLRQLIAAYR